MTFYQPQSMLVTGGAGFIGSNFIRHILTHKPQINIINLDKLTYAGSLANLKNLPNETRYHFIQGDITDQALMQHLLIHHCIDTIVHFAAESHVDRSIHSPENFIHTNIVGTYALLEAARNIWLNTEKRNQNQCRFHHISTDEVYGSLSIDAPPFTEAHPFAPRSPYSASKASSDHLVAAYFHTYGLPITISHCSNNYGPYQHPEKFIPTVIRACLAQQKIPVYGNGKNRRDWLYVEDHCRGILQIIESGKIGECYNMGAHDEWENIALARYICALFDKIAPQQSPHENLIQFVKDREGHDFRYAIDTTKIQNELGWKAKENFESGLMKTIHFYARFHSASFSESI
ncbi:MAG: dTDP-glucose 4,6-dehydratase [Gammaproteobacteria bacterium RIFCSPHIGHO2_12_FULL_38_14]|nr:MAG: dTDP-glucose 4,6-dehydratase [Gammaproteobacteria bacterium RIFCSPHIGHO2_12_FULL_38_14]